MSEDVLTPISNTWLIFHLYVAQLVEAFAQQILLYFFDQ